jgi:glycosyltransferase involved in cell wall biosynthesis
VVLFACAPAADITRTYEDHGAMFSLIISTVGRVSELDRLLASLDSQTCKEFEVIVVDQNPDDRLVPILAGHPGLRVRHLRSRRGAARGRNVGLPLAQEDLIAFPDDDCWYPPDLLAVVAAWFADHPEYSGLFTCLRDGDDNPVGPNWPKQACAGTRDNIWEVGLAACGFLRRGVTDAIGLLNENIGVGSDTKYQSGEETDYYLRALSRGFRVWFDPSITVHHPNLHVQDRLRQRTYPFALGAGYVMRVHGYSWWALTWLLIRSLGGAVVSLLKADLNNAYIYLLRAAGQFRGYVMGPRDMARLQWRAN